jgi:hypothetical protein
MSETSIIRTPHDVIAGLQSLIHEGCFSGIKWQVRLSPAACASKLVLNLDDQRHVFQIKPKLSLGRRELDELDTRGDEILVLTQLTDTLVKQCAERNLSAIGLNGRLWIRKPGVVIDVKLASLQRRFRTLEPAIKPFSPRSSRLGRALLSAGPREWTVTQLAQATELSLSRVSELLNVFTKAGWVTGSRGDWRLLTPDGMLDAWAQADNWLERGSQLQYAALEPAPETVARKFLTPGCVRVAFTQWFAANLRYPYTTTPICSVYRSHPLTAEETEDMGLREVSSGGKVWVIVPRDAGVFQFTRTVNAFPVVADVQIYLDLLQVGLRGPDQARALRAWSGFRK